MKFNVRVHVSCSRCIIAFLLDVYKCTWRPLVLTTIRIQEMKDIGFSLVARISLFCLVFVVVETKYMCSRSYFHLKPMVQKGCLTLSPLMWR
jgi:hypothetical protein